MYNRLGGRGPVGITIKSELSGLRVNANTCKQFFGFGQYILVVYAKWNTGIHLHCATVRNHIDFRAPLDRTNVHRYMIKRLSIAWVLSFACITLGNFNDLFDFFRDVRLDVPQLLQRFNPFCCLQNSTFTCYRLQTAMTRCAFNGKFKPAASFLTDGRVLRA
ncbi:hypothetical protein D1872_223310 [compost metagenome]